MGYRALRRARRQWQNPQSHTLGSLNSAMIFLNWHLLLLPIPLALTPLCVLLMWQARRKPLWARVLTAALATPLALVGVVFAAVALLVVFTPTINSPPICSPDGARVARVETWGNMGTYGTDVKIYSLHGLVASPVYSGAEQSVDSANVRWLDSHTLVIQYAADGYGTCASTRSVRVLCRAIDQPGP